MALGAATLLRPGGGFPGSSQGKEFVCIAEDLGSILGSGKCPGKGNDYLL